MKQHHKFIGLDVHKERNEVAIADSTGEVRVYGSISNDLHALEKLVVKLRGEKKRTAWCCACVSKEKNKRNNNTNNNYHNIIIIIIMLVRPATPR